MSGGNPTTEKETIEQATARIIREACAEIREVIRAEFKSFAARSKATYVGADPSIPAGGAAETTAGGETLEDIASCVDEWLAAYPLDVFPQPDFIRAAEVLRKAGLSIDCISAANFRHVLTRVKDRLAQDMFRNQAATASSGAGMAAPTPRGSLPNSLGALLDYQLPCELRLPPATTFGKGVHLRSVVYALHIREGRSEEVTHFSDSKAKAVRAMTTKAFPCTGCYSVPCMCDQLDEWREVGVDIAKAIPKGRDL